MNRKITGKNYDMTSNPFHRVTRHYLLSRVIPMGMYRGGAGLKCVLVLMVSSLLGKPLYWSATRFERQTALLRRIKTKLPF